MSQDLSVYKGERKKVKILMVFTFHGENDS